MQWHLKEPNGRILQRLDEVVTTGTVAATEVKAVPTPISVITAEEIAQKNIQHVDQLFRGVMAILMSHRMGLVDVAMALILLGGITWSALVYAARSE